MAADRPLTAQDIERARALIERARTEPGSRGYAGVAERCGLSRAGISMFARSVYRAKGGQPVGEARIAAKILAALDGWTCPHLAAPIAPQACRDIALAAAPTHHPGRLAHWRACQNCRHRPDHTRAGQPRTDTPAPRKDTP